MSRLNLTHDLLPRPGEALSIAAQMAVALAGFAGVVVAVCSKSLHDWSHIDKFRLLNLLGNALVPLFNCLFGMRLPDKGYSVTSPRCRRIQRDMRRTPSNGSSRTLVQV
jgi:hypothetical protein